MKATWKFEQEVSDVLSFGFMPVEAVVVAVGRQNPGHICLWAIVDTGAKTEQREFYVRGTGHPLSQKDNGDATEEMYVGAVFDGPFVWHVFDPRKSNRSK
jgi:hypothetical protein